jgi:hypothetical protein
VWSTGDDQSAAVCIFESYTPPSSSSTVPHRQSVHGVARLVQSGKDSTILDLTVRQSSPPPTTVINPSTLARYHVYVAQTGDISRGASSAGSVLRSLGYVELGPKDGFGDLFAEVDGLNVWDVIGRAMVVAPVAAADKDNDKTQAAGAGTLAGVIARSAGLWGNEKTVCSCSGLSMWEENRKQAHA